MSTAVRDQLLRQFRTASALFHYHLDGLTTEECLWPPAERGLHVRRAEDGRWIADWPEDEGYGIGPPSIAWISWHIGFWWSMALDHSFGGATLQRDDVAWPGAAAAAVAWIEGLELRWLAAVETLDDADLRSTGLTRWPFTGRPFGDVIGWVTVELTKNAAEIGMARFLYAVR